MKATTIEAILTISSTVGLASLILFGLTVDRLVRILHDDYSEQWIRLGRPVGIFYIPKGAHWSQGIGSLLNLVYDVLVKTPKWLADKPDLLFLVKRVRWCIALAVASLIAGLVLQRLPSSW
jgi:hypothetical protein